MGLLNIYRFIRFLSLDIVFGVVSGSILACKILEINPPLLYQILLPLSVWILYLIDHLIDGFRQADRKSLSAYQSYYDNRKPLISLLVILILVVLLLLIFSFNRIIFQFGVIIGIMVIGYFIFQHLRFKAKINTFPKEPVIAIVYTLGIWGIPFLLSNKDFNPELYLCLFAFVLMVLMNVQLYSILQLDEDQKSGYPSLAGRIGINSVRRLNIIFGIIAGLFCIWIIARPLFIEFRNAGIVFLVMDVSLLILSVISRFPVSKEILGIMADAIFLMPCTILLFQG